MPRTPTRTIEVPANRISQIIAEKRAITADTALRLARYFGASANFWMNLQKAFHHDLGTPQKWVMKDQSLGRDNRLDAHRNPHPGLLPQPNVGEEKEWRKRNGGLRPDQVLSREEDRATAD
jgi:plasmid maintenance system antidote protein VapI